MTIKQILITSLLLSLLVVSSAFMPDTSKAQTETEPADNFQLQTYLTEEQALALVFPECDEIVADEFIMTPEEKRKMDKNIITIDPVSDNPFWFMKVKILTEIIIFYKHFVQGIKIRPSATTDYPRNTRKARNICELVALSSTLGKYGCK